MTKMRLISVGLLLFALATAADAETAFGLKSVWVRPQESPARWATQADPVELAIVRGEEFGAAADGSPALLDGWHQVDADEDGWIRSDDFAGPHAVAWAELEVEAEGIWLLEAMGYAGVYVNGVPRVGNVYGYKDSYESWEPRFDYGLLPVHLRAGRNQLLFFGGRYGLLRARFARAKAPLQFNANDITLPDLVRGEGIDALGSIVVLNTTGETILDGSLSVQVDGGRTQRVELPALPPLSAQKIAFPFAGNDAAAGESQTIQLRLGRAGEILDECAIELRVVDRAANRRVTFRSEIDDSVQYFGYVAAAAVDAPKALFLSLHGASVEAINQSGSYAPISWGHLLAPTNRRPFGFSWEDWGRLDALEVLRWGMERLRIDPDRVYLTGHSMGGHGTWHLGALYPDRFAAIGPSAGWISVESYRRAPRPASASPLEAMVERAALPSETLELAPNLEQLGVYVLHGAIDDNVPPEQSYLMLERLRDRHRDWIYHEQPDVGHWWDLSSDAGVDCVAWPPMFDFFARHRRTRSDEIRSIHFRTPSPLISARDHWLTIVQQIHDFAMSEAELTLDPVGGAIRGRTANVARMRLQLAHCSAESLHLELDGERLDVARPADGSLHLLRESHWVLADPPDPFQKSPRRGGSFRAAFARRPQLVYATGGSEAENAWALAKARYDAEWLWYHGNASVPILPDSLFDPSADPDRSVILYGNAETHANWSALWDEAVDVRRGKVRVGTRELEGEEFGVLAIRPRADSLDALVAIVAGSGRAGCALLDRRPYLTLGISYPDLTLFEDRGDGNLVRAAGFFGNDWSLERGELIWDDSAPQGR